MTFNSKSTLILVLGLPAMALAQNNTLSLEDYLKQVEQKNDAFVGAQLAEKGAKSRVKEGGLIFSPTLFTSLQGIDDKRPTVNVASQGDETRLKLFEFGLSQVTPLGLAAKLSYNLTDTSIKHSNPSYLPMPAYTDSAVKLELNQPLWQNFFGRQFRSMREASEASAKATSLSKSYEAQMALYDAELKYWRLAATRESISILKQNVEQTRNVLEFNKTKVRRNLTDETDVCQSEAMLKARLLDLQSALDDEKELLRLFNAARGENSEVLDREVKLLSLDDLLDKLKYIESRKNVARNDVRAAAEGLRATKASNKVNADKTRPDLSLFAVGSLTNRDKDTKEAYAGMDQEHPYGAIGIKLSLPLDFGARSSVRNGYTNESLGAEMAYRKKLLDQETEWENITNKIELMSNRLSLARDLKDAQYKKLMNERQRQRNGKSSTFQVFQFELDYLSSQLSLVQLQSSALALIAQSKVYQDIE